MQGLYIFTVLACIIPASVLACRGTFAETVTLLEALPEEAKLKNVVAKVRILSFEKVEKYGAEWKTRIDRNSGEEIRWFDSGSSGVFVKALVIEPIKNAEMGNELTIFTSPFNSCNREPFPPEIGREAYVAGNFKDGAIEGQWNPYFRDNIKLMSERSKRGKEKQK